MTSLLKAKNLDFKYNRAKVLTNINFEIKKGDYVGVVGPNGSGKTTLINLLLGLLKPSSGEISYSQELLSRRPIGYLPQKTFRNDSLFPAKVEEIVSTGLLRKENKFTLNRKKEYEKVYKTLKRLNIYDLKNKKIGDLSGGQQQKVLLARAMVDLPAILILDEPTSALDSETREDLYELLKKLNKEDNITIIIVSHDLNTVGKYISKVLHLDNKLIYYGDSEKYLIKD